uniref:Uncharacterized protein n=2 Tax=Schistocephalus solidus TaxID=70667 RepID=A0A0X3PVB8_SCHSO
MSVVEAVIQTLSSLKFDSTNAESGDGKSASPDSETLETAEKLRVFYSLPTIAKNMGAEECQTTLIPMLSELVQKAIGAGDDEVLMVISQKLPALADVLGSEGEGSVSLIPIISEILVCVEEVVVAQAAADAFCTIVSKFNADQAEKKALPLIRKIHEEDLFCASRKVVCKMIIACYPLVPAKLQSELKYRLIHLSDNEEEVPLVRSAAIQQLVELCRLVGADIKTELAPILVGLVADSQRIVRAACVAPLLELGRLLSDAKEFETMIQPCLDKLAEDGSRDTRRALASSMADLQKVAVTHGGSPRSLHLMMMNLLEDNEVETRRVAATQLKDFCLASPPEILTDFLLPRLQEHLTMERDERVRSELVCCAVGLLPSVRREDCLPLVRPILAFLNLNIDQPKQYVFEYFSELMALMPASEIQLTLLPSLVNLWQGKNWRVRLGVVQSVPCLFSKLPESCLRETILPSALAWLRDPTWAVRDCACRTLARLLRSCPSAAKDAIMGTGGGATGGGQANTAGSGTTNSTAASPVGVSSGNAATGGSTIASSLPASSPLSGGSAGDAAATPASLSASVPSDAVATGAAGVANCTSGMSIASLTATAMARGLRALASDSNYHLRQIFILAVQNLFGPGIPDEPVYCALGDSAPHAGLILPATQSLYKHVSAQSQNAAAAPPAPSTTGDPTSASPPPNCSPPPTMPAATLQTCLQLLLQLLSEDPVPNVRFAAARALLLISGSIDQKSAQKQLLPALKKVVESDPDVDVRYFAQDALSVLGTA